MTEQTITIPRNLLESLINDEPCEFDHHGGCQAHGYLSLEPGEICPQEEAKRVLAKIGEAGKETT